MPRRMRELILCHRFHWTEADIRASSPDFIEDAMTYLHLESAMRQVTG